MANDVYVRFGAQLDELIDGVKQAKSAIESVGDSTDKITEGFRTLAEVAGVSLSVAGLKSFVETMSDLGSHTLDSMARLGQSAEQITTLQGVASVAGLSFETLQQSIEKGSLTVQKSLKDAYNPAAAGLKTLGLNAKELIGIPTDAWFSKVADAVSRFNPSLNLTNAVTLAFGKNAANMLPLLQQGSEHFQALQASVKQAQEGLAEAIPGMAEVHDKIAIMELSVQSLGARIFSTLQPAIEAAITSFTGLVQGINSDRIRDVANTIGNALIDIGQHVAEFLTQAGVSVDVLKGKLQSLAPSVEGYVDGFAGAIVRAAQHLDEPFVDVAKKIRDEWSVPIKFKFGGSDDAEDPTAKISEQLNAIRAKADAARSALNLAVPVSGTWQAAAQDVARLNGEVLAAAASFLKMNAAATNTGAKDQIGAQASRIEAEISAEQAKFARISEILSHEASEYKITEQQKAIYTETALQQMYEAEMASIAAKAALYPRDSKAYADAQKEKLKLTQEYQKQMVATVDASQKQMVQTITQDLTMITSSFNSQLRGLLAGTTSWGSAMKNIAGDMFMKLTELGEKWAVDHAAIMIKDLLFTETTEAGKVTAAAGAEAAKTEATVAGAAARAGAETAGASVTIGAEMTMALESIGASIGRVFAGLTAALVPVLGPLAPAGAATIAAGVGATAVGMIHKFDVGTNYVMNDGLAMIHQGETIIPAARGNGPYSSGGGSSGHTFNITFAPNGSMSYADMQRNANLLARIINRQVALNPSLS